MSAHIMHCLVEGCEWSLDATPPDVPETALAAVFGLGVMAATARAQQQRQVEIDCRRHLQSHSVDDWVRTVQSLRELSVALTNQIGDLAREIGGAS